MKLFMEKLKINLTILFINAFIPSIGYAEAQSKQSNNILPTDFLLGLLSGLLSGLLIWYIKERVERSRAHKYFPFLADILIKEIDLFFDTLRKNISKHPDDFANIIKSQVSVLDQSAKNIISEYNWLLQKMDIKKSSLFIEAIPILKEWSNTMKSINLVKLILNYYDSGEKEETKYRFFLELKTKLESYRNSLIAASMQNS